MLWMRPGRVMVQLVPYGWQEAAGSLYRVQLYEQLAHNMNCTPLLWQNTRAEHGYFIEDHFKGRNETYREHPEEAAALAGQQWDGRGELHRHWFFQVSQLLVGGQGYRHEAQTLIIII